MTPGAASGRDSGGLSPLACQVLNIIQTGFPLCHAPYAEIARRLGGGVREEQVHACVLELVERQVIRRLGAVFETRSLGFESTLVAMRVPPERVDAVGEMVSAYPGVSHNYQRGDAYNLWFTLAARSAAELESLLEEIRQRAGLSRQDILDLPTTRMHKIRVNFELGDTRKEEQG